MNNSGINLLSGPFSKAPTFSKPFKFIWPFPPSNGANEENCGGMELSNANPWRSLKFASSSEEGEGVNCGGSCSDAEN